MKVESGVRFNILMVFIVMVGILFVFQLYDLQIVNGASYREQSENRLVREIKVSAPRGEIYDRYGKLIVTSVTGYNANIYYTKIPKTELNVGLLKLANIFEKNGDTYYNNFPIDFETMTFTKSDEGAKRWKEGNKISGDASVEEVIEFYKNKYEIENTEINDIAKIIAMRYEIASKGYSSFKSVTLAKEISNESMLEIEERGNELPGVVITTYPMRKYVAENAGSHIVGYVGKISSDEYKERKSQGYSQNDIVGKAGIEATLEEYLRGQDGIVRLEMDSDGRVTSKEEVEESKMGDSVVLTIDLDLQKKAEEVLAKYIEKIRTGGFADKCEDANAGALVVVDVKTSEVLALASYPNYNPDEFTNGISNTEYEKYFLNPDMPMFNRSIQGTYSPGSTFKMVTAIAAIESGVIGLTESILTHGKYDKGHKPACWLWNSYRQNHGYVNAEKALKVSCNYYFYEVAYRMGIDVLSKYVRMFGLGSKTGIELFGESSGSVASREYINKLNERDGRNRQWMVADTLSAAIGQSYNSFTPLQMAYYVATLANGGVKNEITILKDVISAEGNEVSMMSVDSVVDAKIGKTESTAADLDISKETLDVVFEGMRSVTGESGGTAYSYFASFPIEVAGKTGTATASSGSAHAWFVGFAPYENPEIAVVCMIEHGGHGAYTAPAVKEVMEEYFGYNNEIDETIDMKAIDDILIR
mgnify:CR=1 FL=1